MLKISFQHDIVLKNDGGSQFLVTDDATDAQVACIATYLATREACRIEFISKPGRQSTVSINRSDPLVLKTNFLRLNIELQETVWRAIKIDQKNPHVCCPGHAGLSGGHSDARNLPGRSGTDNF
jgi:hypothetical protein